MIDTLISRLGFVDDAAAHAPKVLDFPEVVAARAALERATAMAEDAKRLRLDDGTDATERAVAGYLAGDLNVAQLTALAAQIEAGRSSTFAATIVEMAITEVVSPAMVALQKIGDRWIEALQPAALDVCAQLDRVARTMPQTPFEMRSLDVHQRSNFERFLERWDAIVYAAERLMGGDDLHPSGRVQRWLHPGRYTGVDHAGSYRQSMVIAYHRTGCTAGLWTKAEVRAASTDGPDPKAA